MTEFRFLKTLVWNFNPFSLFPPPKESFLFRYDFCQKLPPHAVKNEKSVFSLGASCLPLTGTFSAPGPRPGFPYFELSEVSPMYLYHVSHVWICVMMDAWNQSTLLSRYIGIFIGEIFHPFLTLISIIIMDLCNGLCLAGHLAGRVVWKKLLHWLLHANFSITFFGQTVIALLCALSEEFY